MDLLDALRHTEGKTLEFKRDLSSPAGLLRTVVAFANTAGGVVLVGVEDGTRHVRGVADPFALEERIASLITDSIAPRLLPDLEILAYRKTHVVAVQVHPSPARPHHLVSAGVQAGTYVRVGSTNRRADDALIAEMQRFARGEAFDECAIPGLDSEAIDFRAASESFAAVRRLGKKDLDTLRLVTAHQGRQVPTAGGILLFGRDRLRHFPDAWIQVGRFSGTDRARIADHAELKGPLLEAIEQAIAFVEKHSSHGARIGRLRRSEHWSLPPVAVREAVINAAAHSDYLLKCFVLIDLKVGKLAHQHIGQMDSYVRMFDAHARPEGDNPTIGLILCSRKNEAIAKYSVLSENRQIFAAKYVKVLPTEGELTREIERERRLVDARHADEGKS